MFSRARSPSPTRPAPSHPILIPSIRLTQATPNHTPHTSIASPSSVRITTSPPPPVPSLPNVDGSIPSRRAKSVRIVDPGPRERDRVAPWPEPEPQSYARYAKSGKENKSGSKEKPKIATTRSGFRVFVDPSPELPYTAATSSAASIRSTGSGRSGISNPRSVVTVAKQREKEREREKEKGKGRERTSSQGTLLSVMSGLSGRSGASVATSATTATGVSYASFASAGTAASSSTATTTSGRDPNSTLRAPQAQSQQEVKKSRSRLGLDALRAAWGGEKGGDKEREGSLRWGAEVGKEKREGSLRWGAEVGKEKEGSVRWAAEGGKEKEKEGGKWWTIGRKSGEKEREKERARSPTPVGRKSEDSKKERARSPTPVGRKSGDKERERARSPTPTTSILQSFSRAPSPAPVPAPSIATILDPVPPHPLYLAPTASQSGNLLSVPGAHPKEGNTSSGIYSSGTNATLNPNGSIAVRAIKSVRSIAKLVHLPHQHPHQQHPPLPHAYQHQHAQKTFRERERGASSGSGSSWEVGAPSEGGSPLRVPANQQDGTVRSTGGHFAFRPSSRTSQRRARSSVDTDTVSSASSGPRSGSASSAAVGIARLAPRTPQVDKRLTGRARPGLKGVFDLARRGKHEQEREPEEVEGIEDWEEIERVSFDGVVLREGRKPEVEEEEEVERAPTPPPKERQETEVRVLQETPRKRPASEGRMLDMPRSTDVSHITAANTDLSDLISRLDLSTTITPEGSPVKSLAGTVSARSSLARPSPLRRSMTGPGCSPVPEESSVFASREAQEAAEEEADAADETDEPSSLPTPAPSTTGFGRLGALPSLSSIRARHNTPRATHQQNTSISVDVREAWLEYMPGAFGIEGAFAEAMPTPIPTPMRMVGENASKVSKPSGVETTKSASLSMGIGLDQMTPEPTPVRTSTAPVEPKPLTDRLSFMSTDTGLMPGLDVTGISEDYFDDSPLAYKSALTSQPKRESAISGLRVDVRRSGMSTSAESAYVSAEEGDYARSSIDVGDLPELRRVLEESLGGPKSPPPPLPLPEPPALTATRVDRGMSGTTSTRPVAYSTGSAGYNTESSTRESAYSSSSPSTGSFDFTGELNLLNEAGSRLSFVHELESAFDSPFEGFRAAMEFVGMESSGMGPLIEENSKEIEEEAVLAAMGRSSPARTNDEQKSASHMHAVSDSFGTLNSMYGDMDRLLGGTRILDTTMPSMLRDTSSVISDGSSKIAVRRDASRSDQDIQARPGSMVTTSSMGDEHYMPASNVPGEVEEKDAEARNGSDHQRNESQFSVASISSYGQIINPGRFDPFGYAQSARTRMDSTVSSIQPLNPSVIAAMDEARRAQRFKRSTDSDASRWSFHAPDISNHKRGDSSNASVPPISLHNRSNAIALMKESRRDSADSMSSVAQAYGTFGASGGRIAWARHASGHSKEESTDSIISGYSALRLGRPGMGGDKMFESAISGAPLTSILASPDVSDVEKSHRPTASFDSSDAEQSLQRSSFDSIMDERRTSVDSLFDNHRPSSVSSDSVFGGDDGKPIALPPLFQTQQKPRPVSMASETSELREDDTVITMFNGEHAIGPRLQTVFANSPCVWAEKRRHPPRPPRPVSVIPPFDQIKEVAREDLASQSSMDSFKFGPERMARAQQGVFDRDSLEEIALRGKGQEKSAAPTPQFFRPAPASARKKRVGTEPKPVPLVLNTVAPDTPPYTESESGSQSSIDLARLKIALESATPTGVAAGRARARSQGHRRQLSRGSAIETIAEETPVAGQTLAVKGGVPSSRSPSPAESDAEILYARNLVHKKWIEWRELVSSTLRESAEQFKDTEFSQFAVATFRPPRNRTAILAYLEQSQKTYTPLSVRRRTRSRSLSASRLRLAPYPLPEWKDDTPQRPQSMLSYDTLATLNLSERSRTLSEESKSVPVLAPIPSASPMPSFFSPNPGAAPRFEVFEDKNDDKPKSGARPRVKSDARRAALGWSRRTDVAGSRKPPVPTPVKSGFVKAEVAKLQSNEDLGTPKVTVTADKKENESSGMLMSPADSVRLSRPRPKGRTRQAVVQPLRF